MGCGAAEQVAWESACIDLEIGGAPTRALKPGCKLAESAELRQASDALSRLLAGFGVRPDARTEAMIDGWSRRALMAWQGHPEADLTACALAEAEADLNRWFGAVLGSELVGDEPPARAGRAAYLLCGAGDRWPECFLSSEAIPPHVVESLRKAVPPTTPPAQPAAMPEQALEPWTLRNVLGTLPRAGLRVLLGRTAAAAP